MKSGSKHLNYLLRQYKDISVLESIGSLLDWDLNVYMPDKAGGYRAAQSSYIAKNIAEKWQDKSFRKSLEFANNEDGLSVTDKYLLRNINHSAIYYHRVPQKLIVELSDTTTKAFMAWKEAREKNNFEVFSPCLKKIVELQKQVAESIGYDENAYDVFLDIYEPGFSTKEATNIFSDLTNKTRQILKKIAKNDDLNNKTNFQKYVYSKRKQKAVAKYILQSIGFDFSKGRMDVSPHPFTTELGDSDTRITNRYQKNDFIESMMIALHEGGHALYEQGVNAKHAMTPFGGGVSLGIHESQSRFYENQIGRSRSFVKFVLPYLRKIYPDSMVSMDEDELARKINKVETGFIRVEADEVTYNLHIALRFELEEKLINGTLGVENLPDAWNEKMEKYLGITPPDHKSGVLQDVHWAYGNFGYFPTYTLGNLYAAQFFHAMKRDIDVLELVEEGRFMPILNWLREKIHQHGSVYWPNDLIKTVTGESLNADYFLKYVEDKYN